MDSNHQYGVPYQQSKTQIRMLFDWLVTGQIIATNPAQAVRGADETVRTEA